uniref:Ribulose bisphosphate carboxylase small subunit, chloroplastic n=1 Tax=Cucumis hystrix TaxID=396994 RepID=A0A5P8U3Q8_9ROSI|nr:chloroplast ribulose-1,5-bisphosphate carboxylase/oxygenase small subunit [Cucumis hystrix]
MASSILSSAAVASVNSASPAQASMVAPFTGLKSSAGFPITRKNNVDITTLASNGGKVQCMKVWPPRGVKKFETLSYLPDMNTEQLGKEVEYLIRNGWIPCLEFQIDSGFVYREHHRSPGYYDGRYWTMWKLPMFGCTDSSQVIKEIEEAKKEYPDAFIRVIGFDNVRQVQCISFIAYKPPRFYSS